MKLLRWLPRFRDAYRQLPVLAQRETWSRTEVETFQLERLNAVWQHAQTEVPYYQRLAQDRRLPARFSSLDEFQTIMPRLSKDPVRQNRHDFLSRCAPAGSWKLTGGSTGATTQVYWAHNAYLEKLRARYRFYQTWGIDFLDRTAFLWGHAASFAPGLQGWLQRARQPIEDWLRSRLRLSAYYMTPEVLRSYLARMAAFRPLSLYAYSNAAYLLALEAEACQMSCDSLRMVTLTGETAFPHMVATIECAFGVPAVLEYGSIECGVLANEGPDRTLRVREDLVYLESVPREDGRYDILVTVLYNPAFPLIRYELGDVTDTPVERPARGFSILQSIVGRINDILVARDGRLVHSFLLEAVLEMTRSIRGWRAHQAKDGSVQMEIQPSGEGTLDLDHLQHEFTRLMGGFPVQIRLTPRITCTPAGKHRCITSDMTTVNGQEWAASELSPRLDNVSRSKSEVSV